MRRRRRALHRGGEGDLRLATRGHARGHPDREPRARDRLLDRQSRLHRGLLRDRPDRLARRRREDGRVVGERLVEGDLQRLRDCERLPLEPRLDAQQRAPFGVDVEQLVACGRLRDPVEALGRLVAAAQVMPRPHGASALARAVHQDEQLCQVDHATAPRCNVLP